MHFQTSTPQGGFDIISNIKAQLELVSPCVVSCANVLAIAAEASVVLAGGPSWGAPLGRRDGLTANQTGADVNLPASFESLGQIKAKFFNVGLNTDTGVVALSGAHTFGRARCGMFIDHGTGNPGPTLNTTYLATLRWPCLNGGNGTVLAQSMINMSDISPLTGISGKVGRNCRKIDADS